MTNLPIAQHSPQTPARGTPGGAPLLRSDFSATSGGNANVLPSSTSADEQAASGSQRSGGATAGAADSAQSKDTSGSPAGGAPAAGVAEPFSELLARQIDQADTRGPITTQDTIAIGIDTATADALLAAKETADLTPATTNASGDTAGILAAMLQQIPVAEVTVQRSKGSGSAPPITGSGEVKPVPGGNLLQATGASLQTVPADFIPLSIEVIGHAEMPSNAASITLHSINLAATPSVLTGVMHNVQGYNSVATTLSITAPMGSKGWTDEFTQKISWMSTQQYQLAELHLNPPDLGPVDVVLKISGNQATALFTSPHSAVRDAMENALPKLREILADNGIMLGNATVSDQSLRDRSTDGQMNHGFGTAAQHAIFGEASNTTGPSPAISPSGPMRRHNGMVDTFA